MRFPPNAVRPTAPRVFRTSPTSPHRMRLGHATQLDAIPVETLFEVHRQVANRSRKDRIKCPCPFCYLARGACWRTLYSRPRKLSLHQPSQPAATPGFLFCTVSPTRYRLFKPRRVRPAAAVAMVKNLDVILGSRVASSSSSSGCLMASVAPELSVPSGSWLKLGADCAIPPWV